ncbi:MAG TPA: hypothetical protein VLZ10_10110 [Thermodesulfobacteriota bacterium]|nr:hypothetical protein [Thermodesulfobacteriota bacterium]
MWYGLTKKNIVHGLIVFSAIGFFAAFVGMIGFQFEKSGPRNYWALLFLMAVIPGIWLVLVLFLTVTWLKVDNEQIEWYLWKKIRIFSCPITDITHIGGGSLSAVIIKTRKGTIRLFGLHHSDTKKLSKHLMQINKNIQEL